MAAATPSLVDSSAQQTGPQAPIPAEYDFVVDGQHKVRVLIVFAVLACAGFVLPMWSELKKPMGVILMCLILSAPFLIAMRVTSHLAKQKRRTLSEARRGNYLIFWPYSEEESAAYRQRRKQMLKRKQLILLLLPWVIGMVGAAVFMTQQVVSGVQVAHVMKMTGWIVFFVTLLFGGGFAAWWSWTIPYRRHLNNSLLSVLFLENTILVAGTTIDPFEWRRSRTLTQFEREGSEWLKIGLTHAKVTLQAAVISRLVHECPIPAGRTTDAESVARIYGT